MCFPFVTDLYHQTYQTYLLSDLYLSILLYPLILHKQYVAFLIKRWLFINFKNSPKPLDTKSPSLVFLMMPPLYVKFFSSAVN